MLQKQDLLGHRGLTLPRGAIRRLNEMGIFAAARVSLEHQNLVRRHVVRGIESGGAVKEMGRFITFCGLAGEPLHFLHPLDAIGVNGMHAVVIAPILVRVDLFRFGRTCQLLISRHEPGEEKGGRRPRLVSRVLFRGVNGFLSEERSDEGNGPSYEAIPRFWSRSGEGREIPTRFAAAVRAATLGSKCCGCSHVHFSLSPGEGMVMTDAPGGIAAAR